MPTPSDRTLLAAALALALFSVPSDPAPTATPDAGIARPAVDVPATLMSSCRRRPRGHRRRRPRGYHPLRRARRRQALPVPRRYPWHALRSRSIFQVVDLRFYVHDDVRLARRRQRSPSRSRRARGSTRTSPSSISRTTPAPATRASQTNAELVGLSRPATTAGATLPRGKSFATDHTDLAAQPSPPQPGTLSGSRAGAIRRHHRAARELPGHPQRGLADAAAPGDLGAQVVSDNHFTHVGSNWLDGQPRRRHRRHHVLEAQPPQLSFAAFDATTQRVVVDLAAVKEGSNLTADERRAIFTLTTPASSGNIGLDWSTGAPSATQTAFRVE